jgi:hypothetical protein
MPKRLFFTLLAAAAACGQGGPDSISPKRLKADLTFLTSTALEGRLSLQRGSEAAAQWVASEFEKAGLSPAAGGSFLQQVPLIEYRTDRAASRLTVTRGSTAKTYEFPDFSGGFPEDIALDAPVVFAGFGITAPELNYDDYAGLDARGKIVLIFDHEPQENDAASIFNGRGNTRYAGSYVKLANAAAHGAAAVLLVAEPNRKHPSNQERQARVPGGELRRRRLPSQALSGGGPSIPLVTISDKLAADLLSAGARTPSSLQASIDSALKPAGFVIPGVMAGLRLVNASRRRGVETNIIGVLEGSDPALRAETVVFSAHHDHDGLHDENLYAGADDNGSGTVGVVELARAFGASRARPRRTLMFAVFAAEERGLLGSYHYAEHPLRDLKTTRAVINFDMIGRNETPSLQTDGLIPIAADTSNDLNLIGTSYSPEYREVVESQNRGIGLKLDYKWDADSALNIFFRSDQYPFALRDIPAVWWFTGFHPDYHQTTDTVEKINFDKMARILRLSYLTGKAFADGTRPPRFVANPKAGGQ